MHDQIKIAVGIEKANCNSCAYLGSECDGGEPEYSQSWPVCRKFPLYEYLKPFPFRTEQKCWEPNFWHSKFTELIDGSDDSLNSAFGAFNAACEDAIPEATS